MQQTNHQNASFVGLCAGNPHAIGGFPLKKVGNSESVHAVTLSWELTLRKPKLHLDEIFNIRHTGSGHIGDFRCSQWQKFRRDYIYLLVQWWSFSI